MGLGAVTHSEGVYCIPDNPSICRNDEINTSNYQRLCHGKIPAPPLRSEKRHCKSREVCSWIEKTLQEWWSLLLDVLSWLLMVRVHPACPSSQQSSSSLPLEGWDRGLDLNNAPGLSAQQVGGNDGAKDKHKGFRLPLKDDLAINKQTAVAVEGTWKVDKTSMWGENVCGKKKAFSRVKILNYVLWEQAKTSSCIWSVTLLKEM